MTCTSAADRVVRVGDAFYREALANVVAAALDRSTQIDVAEALVDRLVTLQVESMRLLYELYRPRPWPDHALTIGAVLRGLRETGKLHRPDPGLAQLEAAGLLEREWTIDGSMSPEDLRSDPEVQIGYNHTEWGREAFKICLAHATPPEGV